MYSTCAFLAASPDYIVKLQWWNFFKYIISSGTLCHRWSAVSNDAYYWYSKQLVTRRIWYRDKNVRHFNARGCWAPMSGTAGEIPSFSLPSAASSSVTIELAGECANFQRRRFSIRFLHSPIDHEIMFSVTENAALIRESAPALNS